MRSSGGSDESAGSGGGGGTTLKKGPWTAAEDAILVEYVKKHGEGNWNAVQKNSGLSRCGKSEGNWKLLRRARKRPWRRYLSPPKPLAPSLSNHPTLHRNLPHAHPSPPPRPVPISVGAQILQSEGPAAVFSGVSATVLHQTLNSTTRMGHS